MQFLLLGCLGLAQLQAMRRISLLRHAGHFRAARALYGRWAAALALTALAAMGGQLLLLARSGLLGLSTALPLHLCSLMGLWLYPALRLGSRRMWHVALYLAVPGGLCALLFPAVVDCAQPQLMRFCFYLLHCAVTLGPWLPLALGWRPQPLGALTAGGFLLLQGALALGVNALTGSNYLFLRAPAAGTPLSFLARGGPWPYVAALGGLCAGVLALEALLAALARRRWPERLPLPLNAREDLGKHRRMG